MGLIPGSRAVSVIGWEKVTGSQSATCTTSILQSRTIMCNRSGQPSWADRQVSTDDKAVILSN